MRKRMKLRDGPSLLCMWELPIWSTSSMKTKPSTREIPMQACSCSCPCSWPCSWPAAAMRDWSGSALPSDTSTAPPWPWLWCSPADARSQLIFTCRMLGRRMLRKKNSAKWTPLCVAAHSVWEGLKAVITPKQSLAHSEQWRKSKIVCSRLISFSFFCCCGLVKNNSLTFKYYILVWFP